MHGHRRVICKNFYDGYWLITSIHCETCWYGRVHWAEIGGKKCYLETLNATCAKIIGVEENKIEGDKWGGLGDE